MPNYHGILLERAESASWETRPMRTDWLAAYGTPHRRCPRRRLELAFSPTGGTVGRGRSSRASGRIWGGQLFGVLPGGSAHRHVDERLREALHPGSIPGGAPAQCSSMAALASR